MSPSGENLLARLDPRDQEYIATLEPGRREVVVSTIARYYRDARLEVGDAVPKLGAFRLDDGERVGLRSLVEGRPLVLVFGSFT